MTIRSPLHQLIQVMKTQQEEGLMMALKKEGVMKGTTKWQFLATFRSASTKLLPKAEHIEEINQGRGTNLSSGKSISINDLQVCNCEPVQLPVREELWAKNCGKVRWNILSFLHMCRRRKEHTGDMFKNIIGQHKYGVGEQCQMGVMGKMTC